MKAQINLGGQVSGQSMQSIYKSTYLEGQVEIALACRMLDGCFETWIQKGDDAYFIRLSKILPMRSFSSLPMPMTIALGGLGAP